MKSFFAAAVILMIFISGCSSSSPAAVEEPDNSNNNNNGNNDNNNNNGNNTAAATFTISGTITGDAETGAKVTLSGAASGETTTDAEGKYAFSNLAAGDYTVTPSKDSAVFDPSSWIIASMAANFTADFSSEALNNNGNNATAATFTIFGTITGAAGANTTVTLSGDASSETTTGDDGEYSFGNLSAGNYTVTPSREDSAFGPSSQNVALTADFTSDFISAAYQSASISSSTTADGTVNACDGGDLGVDATGRVGKEASVGDCDFADRLYRTFFNFNLATAGIGTSATIVSATLSFSQAPTLGNPYTGNNLTIDHINYGDALGTEDWNADVLANALNTAATAGVVTISTDLKDAVQSDVSERRRTQFRLSFPDAIAAGNYITIERGAGALNPPTLNVTYYQF